MKNKNLKQRFIAIIAIFAVFLSVLWFIYQNTVFSYIRQNANETVGLAETFLMTGLNDEFSRMILVSSVLSGSVSVQDFISEKDAAAYYEKAVAVSEIIRKATYPHINADGIITITADGRYFRFTGGISNDAISKIYNGITEYGVPLYSVKELDGVNYFCFISPVYARVPETTEMSNPAGYIVTLSNIAKLRRALAQIGTASGIDAAIIFGDAVLLSTNPELDGRNISELERLYDTVAVEQVSGSSLFVAAATNNELLNFVERLYITVSVISFAVLIIILALLYGILSSKMVSPMLEKADNMRIGLLKTQINAHFVVNTVNCIETLSRHGENEKAAAAAENLAGMLKNIHEAGEETNIFEQLENIRRYIEIMNIRNNGKFAVETDVDDLLVDYLMPEQILQPLVENALTHGLGNKPGDCVLTIAGRIEQEKKSIIFEVSDNGAGMPAEAVRALQEHLDSADEWDYAEHGLKGVALVNTQRRIRMRYGRKYGVTVKGGPETGMTFTVRLPMIEDKT